MKAATPLGSGYMLELDQTPELDEKKDKTTIDDWLEFYDGFVS